MSIGKRISEFRKERGLTQVGLASAVGVTDKAVSKWERDISCPDIGLLSDIAKALGVTADELLQGKNESVEEPSERFISLEKYLMGDFGYTVFDFHPHNEEVALILDSPDADDAMHGYALSGSSGAEANRFLFGEGAAFSLEKMKKGKLGVTYISNVPLWNLEPPINKLVDELEYTRLNRYHINRLLLDNFIKKLERLVLSDTVRVIAITRDLNQKYFGAFISYASPKTLSVFFDKISSGELKVLYVGLPRFWNSESYKKPEGLIELKKYFV